MSAENLKTLLAWLDGRKTYFVAAAAVFYTVGADAGWWPLNESVCALLAAAGLGALRAAVRKSGPTPPPA